MLALNFIFNSLSFFFLINCVFQVNWGESLIKKLVFQAWSASLLLYSVVWWVLQWIVTAQDVPTSFPAASPSAPFPTGFQNESSFPKWIFLERPYWLKSFILHFKGGQLEEQTISTPRRSWINFAAWNRSVWMAVYLFHFSLRSRGTTENN